MNSSTNYKFFSQKIECYIRSRWCMWGHGFNTGFDLTRTHCFFYYWNALRIIFLSFCTWYLYDLECARFSLIILILFLSFPIPNIQPLISYSIVQYPKFIFFFWYIVSISLHPQSIPSLLIIPSFLPTFTLSHGQPPVPLFAWSPLAIRFYCYHTFITQ